VIVEYSGLDTNYPLDSVSAGYSTSGNPTGLLDSGTVAPGNSNLLVFGGGTSDNGTTGAGTGFSSIQGSGGRITEQNTNPITSNNTLQRATAGFSAIGVTGNWVMQMAVFRAASANVFEGWSPARQGNVVYADQYSGGIKAAISALPATGGTVVTPVGYQETSTTEIDLGSATQPVRLECGMGTVITSNINDTMQTQSGIKIFNDSGIFGSAIGGGCLIQAAPTFHKKSGPISGATV
jgi:hypothetical protein